MGVPSCSRDSDYEEAIGGCDQPTIQTIRAVYNANTVDLRINPDIDTGNGVQCLTHQNGAATLAIPPVRRLFQCRYYRSAHGLPF